MYVLAGVTYFPATFCESTETVHTVSDMDPHGKVLLLYTRWLEFWSGMHEPLCVCVGGGGGGGGVGR